MKLKTKAFTVLENENPSWRKDFVSLMRNFIKTYEEQIIQEAKYEGEPSLANINFLYERFKLNCENLMYNGNWQILKYFTRILRLKIFRSMISEVDFTKEEIEMYDYFKSVKVNSENRCKPKQIKFVSGTEIQYPHLSDPGAWYHDYVIYLITDRPSLYNTNYVEIPYGDLFSDYISLIDDIILNCEMKPCIFQNDDLFHPLMDFKSRRLLNERGFSYDNIKKITTIKSEKECKNFYGNVDELFLAELEKALNNDETYLLAKKKLKEASFPILVKLIKEKEELFNYCSETVRKNILDMINNSN